MANIISPPIQVIPIIDESAVIAISGKPVIDVVSFPITYQATWGDVTKTADTPDDAYWAVYNELLARQLVEP